MTPVFSPEDRDLAAYKWSPAGSKGEYAARCAKCVDGKWRLVYAHRIVFHRANGWLPGQVEHRDCVPLNCIRENLRPATGSQNLANRRAKLGQFKGVTYRAGRRRWLARVTRGRKDVFLGYHKTAEAAARAYDVGAKEVFGEFARLNYPI